MGESEDNHMYWEILPGERVIRLTLGLRKLDRTRLNGKINIPFILPVVASSSVIGSHSYNGLGVKRLGVIGLERVAEMKSIRSASDSKSRN